MLNELNNLTELLPRFQNVADKLPVHITVIDAHHHIEVEEFCQNFSKVKYLVSPKKGRANQMNFAAKQTSADVLYFVHADTRPPLSFYSDIQGAFDTKVAHGSYRFKFDTQKKRSFFCVFNFSKR